MKNYFENNRKIFIDEKKHFKFKELKNSANNPLGIFDNMKDVFLAAAILGYNDGNRMELEKRKDIFDVNILKKYDKTLIYSIYLDYVGDANLLEEGKIISVIEEYANDGIDILYDIVNRQGDALNNIVEEVMINYL